MILGGDLDLQKWKKKMLEIIGKFGKYKLPFISHFKISQKAVNCLRVSGG